MMHNEPVATIYERLGYADAAYNLRHRNNDVYERWTEAPDPTFFRPDVTVWADRKFLNLLFKQGSEAILEHAQLESTALRKLAANCSLDDSINRTVHNIPGIERRRPKDL